MADHPLRSATDRRLGGPLPHQLSNRTRTHPDRIPPFTPPPCEGVVLCGISTCFQVLFPCLGQIAHALLTRPPLEYIRILPKLSSNISPFDLHVLSTPPAFVLSQDQTLMFNPSPFNAPYSLRLAKASAFNPISRRLTLRNLTVLFLSSLYRFQGSQGRKSFGFSSSLSGTASAESWIQAPRLR